MDTMLSSSTRWQCQYKSITDSVDCKVSECGESFMTLLITITGKLLFEGHVYFLQYLFLAAYYGHYWYKIN